MRIKKLLWKTVAVATTAVMLTDYGSVLDTEASEYESDSEEISVVLEEDDSDEDIENQVEDDLQYEILDDGTIEITGYIGSDAEIEIPSTIDGYAVTIIGDYAFYCCGEIISVIIPEGVTCIGENAFENCYNLVSVVVPDSVTSIGKYAFVDCSSLVSINIPENITSIEEYTFDGCCNLASIEIPENVESIGEYAFGYCYNLTSMVIPESVTSMGDGAFSQCFSLTKINIPDGVTSIGEATFLECTSLEKIDLPDGITSIGEAAFSGCKNLTSIEIPDSVTSIGDWAFEECDSFVSIEIPAEVTSISSYIFSRCDNLANVSLPSGVTSIDIFAFGDCISLTDIYYAGSETQWNNISFCKDWNYMCPDNMEIHYGKLDTPAISSLSNTTSGIKVTWSKISGASGYYIYRKTGSSGTYKKIKTVTSASTVSYTDTSVSSGTTYYYYVKAYNGSVTSDYKAKSKKYLKAGKISSLTNKSGGITIKWSKVTGASGYYIYRKTSSGSYSKIKTITSGSTLSYTDTKVKSKNGTTYVYKVVPYLGSTIGSFTAKTTVRLTGTTLSSVKNSSSKKMTVKWSKKSSITGYQIQYSTSSSFSSYKTVTVSGASKVSKVISSLTKNKTYYVRIRTYKTVSGTKYYSAWSSKKSIKIKK